MKLKVLIIEDLRYVRWLLLINLAIVGLYALLAGPSFDSVLAGDHGGKVRQLPPFLIILYFVSSTILVSKLFVKDSPCDVEAFWLSKPIQSGELLAAKAIIVVVALFLIPCTILWFLVWNSGEFQPWGVLVRYLYWLLWFLPMVLFFSAITSRLSTILVSLVAAVGTLVVGFAFAEQFHLLGKSPSMAGFGHLASYGVFALCLVAAVYIQFRIRIRWISIAVGSLGFLLAIAFPLGGANWRLGPSEQALENKEIEDSMPVAVSALEAKEDPRFINQTKRLTGQLSFSKVPAGFKFILSSTRATLRPENDPPQPEPDRADRHYINAVSLRKGILEAIVENGEINEERLIDWTIRDVDFSVNLRPSDVRKAGDQALALDLDFELARMRIENVDIVSLKPGNVVNYDGIRTKLHSSKRSVDGIEYSMSEYEYEGLSISPPIQFRDGMKVGKMHRIYLLREKDGTLFEPTIVSRNLGATDVFGLSKRFGVIDLSEVGLEQLSDGDFELIAIDLRFLGNMQFRVSVPYDPDLIEGSF